MKERALAKRYSRAIFDLAVESKNVEKFVCDIECLCEAASAMPAMLKGLTDNRIILQKRIAAAQSISEVLGLGKITADFFKLLVSKARLNLLLFIGEDFVARAHHLKKMIVSNATVADSSAINEVREHIKKIIGELTGFEAECKVDVDPSLIGGFCLRAGDISFDASLSGKMVKMKEELL